jgi:hypothetical protein
MGSGQSRMRVSGLLRGGLIDADRLKEPPGRVREDRRDAAIEHAVEDGGLIGQRYVGPDCPAKCDESAKEHCAKCASNDRVQRLTHEHEISRFVRERKPASMTGWRIAR